MNTSNTTELMDIPSGPMDPKQHCPTTSDISYMHYTLWVFNFICLFITVTIAWITLRHFIKLSKLNTSLKCLFCVSVISACLCTLSSALAVLLCLKLFDEVIASRICILLIYCGYLMLFLSLLGTLLVRLYTTFNHTIYKISCKTQSVFIILYIIMIVISVLIVIITAAQVAFDDGNRMRMILLAINGFVYVVTAIAAVFVFSNTLMKVTQSHSKTLRNVLVFDADVLNKSQQKLVTSIARYVALFTLASVTSLTSLILLFIGFVRVHNRDVAHSNWTFVLSMFVAADCAINVVCLYLQYVFATKHYKKYCSYMHSCFKSMFTKQVTHAMEKQYTDKRNARAKQSLNVKHTNHSIKERQRLKSQEEDEDDTLEGILNNDSDTPSSHD
eukprot:427867_1